MIQVVIPSFGKTSMTQELVRHVQQESEVCRVLVVDNKGDYCAASDEEVLRPGSNLGWLRGCNAGLSASLERRGVEYVCLLNNDVHLCPSFMRGLLSAAEASSSPSLIAPLYDDVYENQASFYRGPADQFVPQPVETAVDLVDGTCLLVPVAIVSALGKLDEQHFGIYGWGGADDYCLRVRRAGMQVLVTRRAYLQHMTGTTASVVHSDYRTRATAEMYVGMRRKYGRDWMRAFPSGSFAHHTTSLREYNYHLRITCASRSRRSLLLLLDLLRG